MPVTKEEKEKQKRQVKLRKELTAFLNKLRDACKTFENATQWLEFVKPLEKTIEQYADVLAPNDAQRLKGAMKLVTATIDGIRKSCGILQREIERVILLLPVAAGVALAPWIIAAFIGVAVIAGGTAIWLNLPVQVQIQNLGCETIPLGAINLPGATLPREIPKNGTIGATLPRVSVNFEASGTGTIQLSVPNTPVQFSFATSAKRIELDGANIIGQRKSVNLGDGVSHLLVINCQ